MSMNVDKHLSGFFVKNYFESFCDATNLSAGLFLFHCSDYDFRDFQNSAETNEMHGAVLLEMVKIHINKTYLSYVIDEVEGKSKGPNILVKGSPLNKIKSIPRVLRRI